MQLLLLVALIVGCSACGGVVKPKTTIPEAELKALTAFDYSGWTTLLKTHVNDKGQVNYPALNADRAALDTFVAQIAAVGPKTRPELFKTDADKLAYYINAYNALTMFNVINRYPEIKSVYDSAANFFVLTEFLVDGEPIDLRALENDVVRKQFDEPRIHFALNCASVGCPQLPPDPFLPATLDAQLKRETDKFLRETRNVEFKDGKVVLSEIFKWYAEDFKPSPLAWIRAMAPDLNLPEKADISHRAYDWALNDSTRL
jgi:hypothetical protein